MGVVQAIVDAIKSAGSAKVIDFSLDSDHNRSVVTILGEISQIESAMMAGAEKAVELIDMRMHRGQHPRIGAVDVVPVVPVIGCTMADCIALSYEIGKSLADHLSIPVYFYEQSAGMSHRTNLSDIRKGGYEGLLKSGLTGDRQPDLGPSELHPTAGATAVGARGPLIAFNVNLKTDDLSIARDIALKIRRLRDEGKGMTGVKAMGVDLHSRGIVQVSTNITQPHVTSVYKVYSFIADEAKSHGVEVVESELIGALRQEALIESIRDAIRLPNISESQILDTWLSKMHDQE